MYTDADFRTKKALKEALAAGKSVGVYQPGGIFPSERDGEVALEGPHYPAPHTWYARVRIKDGVVVKILD